MHAAFALDGLEDDGADGVVELGFEIGDIAEFYEFDAGEEGRERVTIFFGESYADAAEGAAVKRVLHGEDAVLGRGLIRRVRGRAGAEAGEFQSAVGSFGAAVGEEDAAHAGDFGELARERALVGVVIEIAEVDGARGFTADGFYYARVGVAESVDGDAAEEVEIFFARRVIHVGAVAVGEDDGLALVGGQEELFGVAEARVELGLLHCGADRFLVINVSHHAAESAACAAGRDSRRTRVPGMAFAGSWERSGACDTRRRESCEPAPTMCTSRTPPSSARLAASSFNTIPPETTRDWTRRSISSQLTAERTLSPSRTPATSVR